MRTQIRDIYLRFFGSFKHPKPGIHVINAHYVSRNEHSQRDIEIFENFIKYITGFATIITLQEATKRIHEKNLPSDQIFIALTFDDGFEECYTIIAPVLEKYGARGTFFINSNYIDSDQRYQKDFNARVDISTKLPMSWHQLKDLHHRDHLIGSHGLDHLNMKELCTKEIEYQLKTNKNILEKQLNYKCEYFAWTYGQFSHFSKKALQISLKYHPFVFSATNYKHYFSYDGKVLNRRQVEPFWPTSHINYFLAVTKKQ